MVKKIELCKCKPRWNGTWPDRVCCQHFI